MAYKCFDKKSANTSGGVIKSKIMSSQWFADKLHIPIIRNFKRHKIYSTFRDLPIIWDGDLDYMQLISK